MLETHQLEMHNALTAMEDEAQRLYRVCSLSSAVAGCSGPPGIVASSMVISHSAAIQQNSFLSVDMMRKGSARTAFCLCICSSRALFCMVVAALALVRPGCISVKTVHNAIAGGGRFGR